MAPALESLPSEILLMVIERVAPKDHLAVKLTSKTLYEHTKTSNGNEVIETSRLNARDCVEAHIAIETAITEMKTIKYLVCTGCAKLKSRESYTDSQWTLHNTHRFCIPCGIQDSDYVTRTFLFHGTKHFACPGCEKAVPEEEEAEKPETAKRNSNADPARDIRKLTNARLKARFCRDCVEDLNETLKTTSLNMLQAQRKVPKRPVIDRYANRSYNFLGGLYCFNCGGHHL